MNRPTTLSVSRTSELVERPLRFALSRNNRDAALTPTASSRAGTMSRFLTVLLRSLSAAAA